jgi:HEPN domain-containing protein
MSTEEKVTYWLSLSDEDLRAGLTMLSGGHYLYVGFMCHQCIEKIFKAVYEYRINDTPPYIHDLPRLAKTGKFYDVLSEEQKQFVNAVNPLHIEAHYPEYKNRIAQTLTKKRCEYLLEETKQLQQWIKEKILLIK